MINDPLNPDLLARILRLSEQARLDIWEALGRAHMGEKDLAQVLAELECDTSTQGAAP